MIHHAIKLVHHLVISLTTLLLACLGKLNTRSHKCLLHKLLRLGLELHLLLLIALVGLHEILHRRGACCLALLALLALLRRLRA